MKPDDLSKRLWHFAARTAKIVDGLPETRVGRHVAGQFVRCGTSAPPNYDEGCAAKSRADFIHKLSVALKELRETRGWLYFITISGLLREERVASELDESEQLKRIPDQSVATASGGSARKRAQLPPKRPIRNSQFAISHL